jgi:hypothetical protein
MIRSGHSANIGPPLKEPARQTVGPVLAPDRSTDPRFRSATRRICSLWQRAWRQNRLPLVMSSSGAIKSDGLRVASESPLLVLKLYLRNREDDVNGADHGVDRDRPGRPIRLPAVAGEDGSVSGLLGGRRDRPVRAQIYRHIFHAASCRSGGSGGGSLLIATTIASRYSP